jgi:hypothetical protein
VYKHRGLIEDMMKDLVQLILASVLTYSILINPNIFIPKKSFVFLSISPSNRLTSLNLDEIPVGIRRSI